MALTSEGLTVVLPTAKVKVLGRKGVIEATLLCDSGSDKSSITSDLVKRFEPEGGYYSSYQICAFDDGKAGRCELREVV